MLKVGVLNEFSSGEHRVAVTPETASKFIANGLDVLCECGIGQHAAFSEKQYTDAGAKMLDRKAVLLHADIIVCVTPFEEIDILLDTQTVVGLLKPYEKAYNSQAKLFAMERLPRITRAQNMDALSSQANLLGYRAVIEASHRYAKSFGMMMTAAGTLYPCSVLVIGAGVAGLQAIATAKRLGAVVYAFDVRSAAKEQVMSLGAKFIDVKGSNLTSVYAEEMSAEYKELQNQEIAKVAKKANVIITSAQIPGKTAPKLIKKEIIDAMQKGSVIVDLAVTSGGNTELTQEGSFCYKDSIWIIGDPFLLNGIATDASLAYARNIFNFLMLLKNGYNSEEAILKETLL